MNADEGHIIRLLLPALPAAEAIGKCRVPVLHGEEGRIDQPWPEASAALHPRRLLMADPFNDLYRPARRVVRSEGFRILHDHGTSAIIASRDNEDAFHLGDRIAMIELGRILRIEHASSLRKEWAEDPFAP